MQLKIIQIALGWWGKNIPSKCPTGWDQNSVIPWDEWEKKLSDMSRTVLVFCFRGLGSSSISCRGSLDWRGIPFSSCFSGHWHAARQYVASQCELLCPAGWQRKETHTHTRTSHHKLAAASQSQTLHLRHVCWLHLIRPPLHLYSKSGYNSYLRNIQARGRRMRQQNEEKNITISKAEIYHWLQSFYFVHRMHNYEHRFGEEIINSQLAGNAPSNSSVTTYLWTPFSFWVFVSSNDKLITNLIIYETKTCLIAW